MTWVERGLAEIFGVLPLMSVETEVAQGNDECSNHTLNRWHMQIWFVPFTAYSRGHDGSTMCSW
jgi:hypothetical protein